MTVFAGAGDPTNQVRNAGVVVVTASRLERLLQDTPDIVQVISRNKIEAMHAATTGELLETVTGTARSTGTGSGLPDRSVVSLNGLPPNYTLVLVDGVPLVSEHIHTGQNLELIPLDNIERIEILRGAGSAQYGADAVGGIVNIITRKCAGTGEGSLRAEAGSYDTYAGGATLLIPLSRAARLSSFLNWEQSDGQPILAPAHRVGQVGYERFNAMNRVDGAVGDSVDLFASLNVVDYTTDWRGDEVESRLLAPVAGFDSRLSPDVSLAGRFAYSEWDSEVNDENDVRYQPEAYLKWKTRNGHSVLGGTDFRQNEFERTALTPQSQEGYGLFAQDDWTLSKQWAMTAALRYDAVEDVDEAVSPKLALLLTPSDSWRLRASCARGFRAPSLMELYEEGYGHGGTAYRFGNPDLEPEYSTTYGLAVETEPFDSLQVVLQGFHTRLDDMIVPVFEGPWDKDPSKDVWRRTNIENAEVYGGELAVRFPIVARLRAETGYTYTANEDTDTGRQLPYSPGSSVFANLNTSCHLTGLGELSGFVGVRAGFDREAWNWQPAAGTAQDNADGLTTPLKDYAKLDAGLTLAWGRAYEVYVKVENILGEDIEYLDDAFTVIDGEPVFRVGVKYNFAMAK
jgi:outer membrane receptor for ferrienterochelin and colicins